MEAETIQSLRGCTKCHAVELEGPTKNLGRNWETRTYRLIKRLKIPVWGFTFDPYWGIIKDVEPGCDCDNFSYTSCLFSLYLDVLPNLTCRPKLTSQGSWRKVSISILSMGADWSSAVLPALAMPAVPGRRPGTTLAFHSQSFLTRFSALWAAFRPQVYLTLGHSSMFIFVCIVSLCLIWVFGS